jgi:hypothetical protein
MAKNAPLREMLPEGVISPQHLTLLITKYWGAAPRTQGGAPGASEDDWDPALDVAVTAC